jgi:hypothetical protein
MIRIIPTILKRSDILNQLITALQGVWGSTKDKDNSAYHLGRIAITFVRGNTVTNSSATSAMLIVLEGSNLRGYVLEPNETKSIAGSLGLLFAEI